MKKISVLLCSILIMHQAIAQITLDAICYPYELYLIKLENSGYKYFDMNVNTTINLYNLNLTTFKTITVPPHPPNVLMNVGYITEALFDTDSSTIEYLYEYKDYNSGQLYTEVRDENGNILLHVDSGLFAEFNSSALSLNFFYGHLNPNRVRNTPNGAKLYLDIEYKSGGIFNYLRKQIYSLPGWLECIDCLNPNSPALAVNEPMAGDEFFKTNVFPNPAKDFITIEYALPANEPTGELIFTDMQGNIIKKVTVDHSFNDIKISTADFPSGTYLYSIQTKSGISGSKKLIRIN